MAQGWQPPLRRQPVRPPTSSHLGCTIWHGWRGPGGTRFTLLLQLYIVFMALILAAAFMLAERDPEKLNAHNAQVREAKRPVISRRKKRMKLLGSRE